MISITFKTGVLKLIFCFIKLIFQLLSTCSLCMLNQMAGGKAGLDKTERIRTLEKELAVANEVCILIKKLHIYYKYN